MRLLWLAAIVFAIPVLCLPARSEPLYQGPIPVRLNDNLITIPVTLYAETAGDDADSILVHAHMQTADLAPIMQEHLQFLAREKISACELRLNVPDTDVSAIGSILEISAAVDVEVWVCTILKTRLGGESARIVAGAEPGVRDGRLHLEPVSFQIEGLGELVSSIGGDGVLRDLYAEAIARFNSDPALTTIPERLADAGFVYQAVEVGTFDGVPSTLRISIIGPNDLATLGNLLSGIQ